MGIIKRLILINSGKTDDKIESIKQSRLESLDSKTDKQRAQYVENGYSTFAEPVHNERCVFNELPGIGKLPVPKEDGTLYENRLWESKAKVEPGRLKAPEPSIFNVSALLEETASTLNISELSEVPLATRYSEEIREREAGLIALKKGVNKRTFLTSDDLDLNIEEDIPEEKKIYYNAAVMLNNREAPMSEREDSLMEVLKIDLINIFKEKGDKYNEELPENIATLRDTASWMIEDIDRQGLYIDLDNIREDIFSFPLFESYKDALSCAIDEGTDLGMRMNPLFNRTQELKRKMYSSGIFSSLSFRNIIIASAVKTNTDTGSTWERYNNDPGVRIIMENAAKCVFVERSTPRWQLANALTVAYQIYDITGRWINTLPYFYKSKLDKYMAERYPDALPLISGREEAIIAAYREADGIKCSDCGKYVEPDEETYAIRRTYCGTDGSESFYCPKCAEKILNKMQELESDGNVKIVLEDTVEQFVCQDYERTP